MKLRSEKWRSRLFFVALTLALFASYNNCGKVGFNSQDLLSQSDSSSQNSPSPRPSPAPDSLIPTGPIVDKLPSDLGWSRLPNTKLKSVCPPRPTAFDFPGGCEAVIYAWGGAVADTNRQRLILWGGGHNDYYGNEVYALDLMTQKMVRLNDPTFLETRPDCVAELPNGKPNGRHTYGGLAYISDRDQMYVVGGAPSCGPGAVSSDTWLLDFASFYREPNSVSSWSLKGNPVAAGPRGGVIAASEYDPVTKKVYLIDSNDGFWTYDPLTNTYNKRLSAPQDDYHYSAAIDSDRRLFITFGYKRARVYTLDGEAKVLNLDTQLKGCDAILNSGYPGLAYDSKQKKIVAWSGGPTVYLVDLDTKTCTAKTASENAPGPQQATGTNGRFRYFPAYNAFVLVNDANEDAYVLRLTK